MKHTVLTQNGYSAQITIPKFPSIQPQSNPRPLCECARLTVLSIQELQRSYDADMDRNKRTIESLQNDLRSTQLAKDELAKQMVQITHKHEEQVSVLNSKHTELQKTITALQLRHSTLLKTKIESAKEERNHQQLANLGKVESALKDSENNKHLLTIALEAAKREADGQKRENDTLRNQNDTLKREKAVSQEERDHLKREGDHYKIDSETLKIRQEALLKECQQQQLRDKEAFNSMVHERDCLRKELQTYKRELLDLTAKQQVWQSELQKGSKHSSELQKSVCLLNNQLGNLSQQLQLKTALLNAGLTKQQQLQSQCASKQVQVDQLQFKCQAQQLEMDELRRKCSEVQRVYEVTIERKVDGADRIAQLQAKVTQLQAQKWKLEEDCLRKTNEWDSSRKECIRLTGEVKSLKEYIEKKEKSLGWILNREVQRDMEMHQAHEKGREMYEVKHIRVREPINEYLEYTGE